MNWRRVTSCEPPDCETVYLYCAQDLYPVTGFRLPVSAEDPERWMLEEGGEEDGKHRQYPLIGGGDWEPTHWAPIRQDELPGQLEPLSVADHNEQIDVDLAREYGDTHEGERYAGLPRCTCGHDRSDHWSSGDPVPICTHCDCKRYAPERLDYRCEHEWYTYGAAGSLTTDQMCLLCCVTRWSDYAASEDVES